MKPPGQMMHRQKEPTILFEDNHLIVVDKPAGLLSQGDEIGNPNVVDFLRERWGREFVGLVHRLDRNTSGLMVVGQRSKAARRLTEALQSGQMKRHYLGWLEGILPAKFHWEHLLLKDSARNHNRVFAASASAPKGAKKAVLDGKTIQSGAYQGNPLSLVEFVLDTGRSHQIRSQAAFEGHSLVGDVKYGSRISLPRLALHSHYLSFPHPTQDRVMEFTSPLPEDLRF